MNKIIKFINEARTELQKVSWPTPITAMRMTFVVIGVSLVFALYIAGVDYLLVEGIKQVTRLAGQTTSTPTPTPGIQDIEATTSPVQ
jgi:preprotein translocase SecE subunit